MSSEYVCSDATRLSEEDFAVLTRLLAPHSDNPSTARRNHVGHHAAERAWGLFEEAGGAQRNWVDVVTDTAALVEFQRVTGERAPLFPPDHPSGTLLQQRVDLQTLRFKFAVPIHEFIQHPAAEATFSAEDLARIFYSDDFRQQHQVAIVPLSMKAKQIQIHHLPEHALFTFKLQSEGNETAWTNHCDPVATTTGSFAMDDAVLLSATNNHQFEHSLYNPQRCHGSSGIDARHLSMLYHSRYKSKAPFKLHAPSEAGVCSDWVTYSVLASTVAAAQGRVHMDQLAGFHTPDAPVKLRPMLVQEAVDSMQKSQPMALPVDQPLHAQIEVVNPKEIYHSLEQVSSAKQDRCVVISLAVEVLYIVV